jgi:formylmethanofuran dehydrogenase subunit A
MKISPLGILVLLGCSPAALARPTIEELKARAVLDDTGNVVFGYNIVMEKLVCRALRR